MDAVAHLAGDGAALAALLRPGGRIASTLGLMKDPVEGQDVIVHSIMADANAQTLATLADQAASGACAFRSPPPPRFDVAENGGVLPKPGLRMLQGDSPF